MIVFMENTIVLTDAERSNSTSERRVAVGAFEFFHSGIAAADGVLPVGGVDGSAVSCGPVHTQGRFQRDTR